MFSILRPLRATQRRTLAMVLWAFAAHAFAIDVNHALLQEGNDGKDWAGFGRVFDQQRFSPLTQINTETVGQLGLVSALELPGIANASSAPLAVNGVIYLSAGYSVVHAVDALSGELLWRYDPKVSGFKMRLSWGSRGLALLGDKVFVGTQDGRLLALDANNGTLVWETLTTQPNDGRFITGAPLVYGNTVLIGHGGADTGATRGYVTAYHADTGKQLWRFYTVPGNPAHGFENPAMAMAAKTWTGEWWKYGGGGTVWNAMTYDPEFNRVYIGTGNGAPWNRKIRSPGGGDNLFLSSIVALDAETGEYLWHYQTTPGESWDFNSSQDMVLATLPIEGQPRKVILHAPKNGFFYVIDRADGALISAEAFAKVTWATGIDPKTGRPIETADARYEDGHTQIWPGSFGAHGWPPMAFSPATGLVYIPGRDFYGIYNDEGIDPSSWRMGIDGTLGVNPRLDNIRADDGQAWLKAWNPLTQSEAWRVTYPSISSAGVLATKGDLVFQADPAGGFNAYHAGDGKKLWSFDMGVGSTSPAISYSVNGKQYLSILAGWSGQPMMFGDSSAQFGWVGREHPPRLLTFALGGNATLAQTATPAEPMPIDDPTLKLDPAKVQLGEALYGYCGICHGGDAVAGGLAPDLRASPLVLSLDAFRSVVRDGALVSRGMPAFAEFSDVQLEALQHYIRSRARAALQTKP